MKLIDLLIGIAVVGTSVIANEPEVVSELPKFENATKWAQDLKLRRPSFTLVHTSETKRMWFAVFRTVENNLVWCTKRIGKIGDASGSRKLRDAHGRSLRHIEYDPEGDEELPTQGRNFRTEFKIFHENGWNIYSRDDGSLIPLEQPPPKAFRITYTLRPKDGSESVEFDEVINFME